MPKAKVKLAEITPPSKELPFVFCDLFTTKAIKNAVMTADGQIYERKSIVDWFAREHKTSPNTGLELENLSLTPIPKFSEAIEEYQNLLKLHNFTKELISGFVSEKYNLAKDLLLNVFGDAIPFEQDFTPTKVMLRAKVIYKTEHKILTTWGENPREADVIKIAILMFRFKEVLMASPRISEIKKMEEEGDCVKELKEVKEKYQLKKSKILTLVGIFSKVKRGMLERDIKTKELMLFEQSFLRQQNSNLNKRIEKIDKRLPKSSLLNGSKF